MPFPVLQDRTILITGSAKRIGRAIAIASASAGANVILHYRASATDADQTRREIEAGGRRAWTLKADLARPEEVSKLAQRAFDLADIYGLVNNASLFGPSSFHETKPDEWNSHIAVNLTAPFLLTQEFARLLGKGRIGRVVNMLDWRALRPGPDHFAYTVSKAALAGMTRALALSLSPKVAVNGLALGAILPVEGKGMDSRLTDSIPLGRWGQLREVGHAAVFLLGGPSYLSGEIIQLDGGRHLH